jgi:hypothetical protein
MIGATVVCSTPALSPQMVTGQCVEGRELLRRLPQVLKELYQF